MTWIDQVTSTYFDTILEALFPKLSCTDCQEGVLVGRQIMSDHARLEWKTLCGRQLHKRGPAQSRSLKTQFVKT